MFEKNQCLTTKDKEFSALTIQKVIYRSIFGSPLYADEFYFDSVIESNISDEKRSLLLGDHTKYALTKCGLKAKYSCIQYNRGKYYFNHYALDIVNGISDDLLCNWINNYNKFINDKDEDIIFACNIIDYFYDKHICDRNDSWEPLSFMDSIIPENTEQKNIKNYVLSLFDFSNIKELSDYDRLSGIHNIKYRQEKLRNFLSVFSCLYYSKDTLKKHFDCYSHDSYIRNLADRLNKHQQKLWDKELNKSKHDGWIDVNKKPLNLSKTTNSVWARIVIQTPDGESVKKDLICFAENGLYYTDDFMGNSFKEPVYGTITHYQPVNIPNLPEL